MYFMSFSWSGMQMDPRMLSWLACLYEKAHPADLTEWLPGGCKEAVIIPDDPLYSRYDKYVACPWLFSSLTESDNSMNEPLSRDSTFWYLSCGPVSRECKADASREFLPRTQVRYMSLAICPANRKLPW
jgi:hypothetical protein